MRICFLLGGILATGLMDPRPLFAAGVDSSYYPNVSWLKVLAFWPVLLLWIKSANWINQDAIQNKLDYRKWNTIHFFPVMIVFLMSLLLPLPFAFFISLPVLILAWLIPFFIYVGHRNAIMMDDDKVFTRPHLRAWFSGTLAPVGIKIASERKTDQGPALELVPMGGATERDDSVHLLTAKQSPGFLGVRVLLQDTIARKSSSVMLDFTREAVSVRYQLDGFWHNGDTLDRENGDAVLAVMKLLSSLNPEERRNRQSGEFQTIYKGKTKYRCRITSQGTKTGERAIVVLDDGAEKLRKFNELGMREKIADQIKELAQRKEGMIVVSAPPAGGLSALFSATLNLVDRYMRSVIAIEPKDQAEVKVDNVQMKFFDRAAGENAATVLPGVIREYPDVIGVTELTDAKTASILVNESLDDRLTVGGIRAKEASEALVKMTTVGIPIKDLVKSVYVVINQRLIRKLCDKCKEAYQPQPQVLQQLGLPANRVEALYKPHEPTPEEKEVCPKCRGIGYLGRTGIFELLVVDDNIRQLLQNNPQVAAIRQAARKAGMKTLQEEGIFLVATGVTSLPELMRVLKE